MVDKKRLKHAVFILGLVAAMVTWVEAAASQRRVRNIPAYVIDLETPLEELLPIPPKMTAASGPIFTDDLEKIPQVYFQDPTAVVQLPMRKEESLKSRQFDLLKSDIDKARRIMLEKLAKSSSSMSVETNTEVHKLAQEMARERERELERIDYQIHKITFLNMKKVDHFLELLLQHRTDLAGLPFVMGDSSRLKREDAKQFSNAVTLVRASRDPADVEAEKFWAHFDRLRQEQDPETTIGFRPVAEGRFHVAALMQMFPADGIQFRLSLAERLPTFERDDRDKREVTRALARLAIFAQEKELTQAALAQLRKRDTLAATDILQMGLRYPWPAVARNAAQAIASLGRRDLVPDLKKMLDEPDPRVPEQRDVKGKKTFVIRELVRVDHMRNCLLCHPPHPTPNAKGELSRSESSLVRGRKGNLTHNDKPLGAIPAPGEIPSPSEDNGSYGGSFVHVQADITYLRQDFSLMQKWADADAKPTLRRFDFLIRTREITEAEAEACHAHFDKLTPTSPYREAASSALRQLIDRGG